jgi:hypothetical protein
MDNLGRERDMKKWTAATAWTFALALAGPAQAQVVQPHPPMVIPSLALEDQFKQPHSVAAHLGDVVVLIYGDQDSADANKVLGEHLHDTFHPTAHGLPAAKARLAPVRPLAGVPPGSCNPDVVTVPVACIGKVLAPMRPALVRKVIRNQVRDSSADVPVWLDFQGQLEQQFGLARGVPNVLVIDATGCLRYTAKGVLNADQVAHLAVAIEGLRREAALRKLSARR